MSSKKKGFWELFSLGYISSNWISNNLNFIFFIAFLTFIYITNAHLAESKVRTIQQMNKNLRELRWEYKSAQAELMRISKQTEFENEFERSILKESIDPPKKILVE